MIGHISPYVEAPPRKAKRAREGPEIKWIAAKAADLPPKPQRRGHRCPPWPGGGTSPPWP